MSDEAKGAPDWIVTFSDIISLLVTFFIMILTWSTLAHEDFELVRGSLQGALGVVDLATDRSELRERLNSRLGRTEDQGALNPAEDRPFDSEFDQVAIRLKKQFGEEIDLDMLRKGYRIRISADSLFEPGSARITPACRDALDEIAAVLKNLYFLIRVDGHTDDAFSPTPRYPTAWHLSVARATAAARYLVGAGPIEPERVSVAGYAGQRPAYPNHSDALRARNRRIEILILNPSPKQG